MADSKKPGFLDDNAGNPSSMRAMCGVSLAAAIAFGYVSVTGDGTGSDIILWFLVGAFAPKAVQKFAENK